MTKRKIGKGKAIEELVKGSYDYTLHTIRQAFYRAFPDNYDEMEIYWIIEAFTDYLIVNAYGLPADEFWRVSYSREPDGSYAFAGRDDWELVELTYQPATRPIISSKGEAGPRKFVEQISASMELVEEARSSENTTGPWRIKGHGVTADIVNYNNHRYPGYATARAVREAQNRLAAEPGRLVVGGEVDHPSDKGQETALLGQTTFMWDKIELKDGKVLVEGTMFGTQEGRDMYARMQGGLKPDLSQRAWGQSITVEEDDGTVVEEIVEFSIAGYDAVTEGADPFAGVEKIESTKSIINNGGKSTMDEKDKDEATISKAEVARQKVLKQGLETLFATMLASRSAEIQAKVRQYVESQAPQDLDEARNLVNEKLGEYDAIAAETRQNEANLRKQLGIGETDDLATALAERESRRQALEMAEQQRNVHSFIEKETKGVTYPQHIKDAFISAIKADKPTTEDEAKEIIAKHKEVYGKLAIEFRKLTIGMGVDVLGPVIEETGYPEFALASLRLNESLRDRGMGQMHGLNRQVEQLSVGEAFALRYLKKFDEKYGHILAEESRRFNEAQQTTDMNLPYSVLRAIMPEALANLVALSVFDVDTTDQSPARIYYEDYSDESGATATVTDEAVTADTGVWVQMSKARIQPGTVVVTNSPATTTYTEGSDYVIDYGNGRLMALAAGAIADNASLLVDFTYDAIRKGEMQPIERGKQTLSSKTLEIKADRLASQISKETVVFSRSQLGYDAVTRNLAGLVRRIQEKIDKDLFYLALTAALMQANNSGGTWNSAANPVDKLVEYIGYARVKVANRFYAPTAVILSLANSDRLSNWEGFSAAGSRSDADLNAAGYVGRVKGLPVFETTQFSDAYALVINREVVMHRVFQPAMIEGPFPSYDTSTGKLIAANQYYVEEMNGSDAPIPEKASYVGII